MTSHVTVGLIDDDPLLLRLLRDSLIHAELDVVWAGTATDAAASLAEDLPDVIAIDIKMPEISGFDLARSILKEHPEATIMMLTSLDDADSLAKALDAGAVGYLVKSDPPEMIAAGIRAAAAGLRSFSPRVGAPARAEAPTPSASPLTPREEEVLALVAQSLTNDQIARKLALSTETVKRHVSSILRKLDVPDRLGAVMWGVRNHSLNGR